MKLRLPLASLLVIAGADWRVTGLTPLLEITDAPKWAQAAGGAASKYAGGGYKPSKKGSPVVSVGQFTRSGSGGQRLERVSIASAINAVAE
jgi:hypothetical protein